MSLFSRGFATAMMLAGLCYVLSGCAAQRAPLAVLAAGEERQVREAAAALLMPADGCGNCLDVEVRVVVQSLWQSGTLEGYLLARAPGALKFVGLSPLGQPLLMLATNGTDFRFVSVAAATVYDGTTAAAAFRKHAPAGLDPQSAFYWLIGRISRDSRIVGVERAENEAGYWLTLAGTQPGVRHRVLFDPAQRVVSRAVLLDEKEQPLLDVRYGAYEPVAALGGQAGCRLPGTVVINSRQQNGAELSVRFSNWLLGTTCNDADFVVPVPPGFVTERVE
jgi:hypothetical protein